jgi:hypothetical protein
VLRTWSIALAAMVAGPTAQAADATLSLACKGTATIRAAPPLEYKPQPISTGLLINFTSRTVRGTERQGPYLFYDQLQITEWNEVTVIFRGFSHKDVGGLLRAHLVKRRSSRRVQANGERS